MNRVLALAPELVLALTGLAVFAGLMAAPEHRPARARAAGLAGAVLLVAACLVSFGHTLDIFWVTYRVDAFSQFVKLAVAVGFLLSLLIAGRGAGQRDDTRGELVFFLLTSTAGLTVMASTVEVLALYIALEIASFSLFVLVPLREGFGPGKEAGVKFLFAGLAASTFTLLGLAILVGMTGTTRLDQMELALAGLAEQPATLVALALFLSGFLSTLALFPFHFGATDLKAAASHGVAAFVATASKRGAVALLVRLVALTGLAGRDLAMAVALAAAIAMTLGNLVAIVQRDVKRMLAWSAVAQAGYIAVGLTAFDQDGMAAALFYGVLYLLMNAAAFLVVARVGADGRNPSLDDLRGLHRRAPLLAATLLLAVFALAGVPPTAGFIGKWFLFRAAMGQGWWWLVGLGAINATVSIYYYLVVVKHAYLLPAEREETPVALSVVDKALCYGLSAALIVFGFWPGFIFDWAVLAAAQLP